MTHVPVASVDISLGGRVQSWRAAEETRDREAETAGDGADADLGPTETWGSDDGAGQPSADTATLLSELAGEDASSESGDGLQQEVDAVIERLEALRGEVE